MTGTVIRAVAICVVAAAFFLPRHTVDAAGTMRERHFIVELSAPALGADPNLRVPLAAAHFGLHLDADLPSAQMYSRRIRAFQNAEVSYLRQAGIGFSILRRFHVLIDGLSVRLNEAEVTRLTHMANVRGVYPVRRYRLLLDRSIKLVHAPEAWAALGGSDKAGRGMMIADIDSGIDISHPCFRDQGFSPPPGGRRSDTAANYGLTNNKVVVARAFGTVGKHYSAADRSSSEGGHGTFTAAIEACDYDTLTPLGTKVSGVAPAAYLMNYNIFPDGSSVTSPDDPVIPALEAAVLDGADVINLSFGDVLQGDPRLDADVQAVESAIKNGVVVVAAAGNAGPTAQSISSPATAPDAISVGATTNGHVISSTVDVSDIGLPQGLQRLESSEASRGFNTPVGPKPLSFIGLGRRPGDDPSNRRADDIGKVSLSGHIALIERGKIPFEAKIRNAAAAGADAAIVYDNTNEPSLPAIDEGKQTLPVMAISMRDGKSLLSWLTSHPSVQATLDPKLSEFAQTPNLLSDFSSRGYGPNYSIEPDIVAPGQDIYSAADSRYPSNGVYNPTGFASASGTSFSAPHVSGAAALVRQAHPLWTPAQVKSVLMETAQENVHVSSSNTPPVSVMQVGSGLVDAQNAVEAEADVMPSELSFGSIDPAFEIRARQSLLVLHNFGSTATWHSKVVPLHGSPQVNVAAPGTLQVDSASSRSVKVRLSVSSSAPNGDYDGYIEFSNGSQALHVPYFVHVAQHAIRAGSVLLVDASTSRYRPPAPLGQVPHKDISGWYERALQALGWHYTYWNEANLGSPSLNVMRRAGVVIYFTGANLNGWVNNSSPEALLGPVGPNDLGLIHAYLDGGGRLFISGKGVTLSDFDWSTIVLGAQPASLSAFDVSKNDPAQAGGISPPRPSAVPDTRTDIPSNKWIFVGLKPIDFSARGDGARDMQAVRSQPLQQAFGSSLVGVPGLVPVTANFKWQGRSHGQAVLRSVKPGLSPQGYDLAVASSDEPSLTHRSTYAGRAVTFAFGFEAINNNTGYATREEVLHRILAWLRDTETARVIPSRYAAGTPQVLRATLRGNHSPVRYQWEVGGKILGASSRPSLYRFPRPGRYDVRVAITDSLGHVAVSRWSALTVT